MENLKTSVILTCCNSHQQPLGGEWAYSSSIVSLDTWHYCLCSEKCNSSWVTGLFTKPNSNDGVDKRGRKGFTDAVEDEAQTRTQASTTMEWFHWGQSQWFWSLHKKCGFSVQLVQTEYLTLSNIVANRGVHPFKTPLFLNIFLQRRPLRSTSKKGWAEEMSKKQIVQEINILFIDVATSTATAWLRPWDHGGPTWFGAAK